MFFYATIFVASLIVALVILWLGHAIADAGKVVYQAMLPSSKGGPTDHLAKEILRTTINDVPTPWGWGDKAQPRQAARTTSIAKSDNVPWGWPGNDREIRDHGQQYDLDARLSSSVAAAEEKKDSAPGWPYREDKFEFAGKAYKVNRKVALEKTDLSTTGKPWGW